jgi:hypothetical protein
VAFSLEVRRRIGRVDRRRGESKLARVVPDLEPRVLHQIVRRWGLEEAGEIVALASSEQLLRVFDLDLWHSDGPGGAERFDAERFGLWLEVLHDAGPAVAARKIAEMDFDFVAAALSEHVLVREPVLRLFPVDDEPADDAGDALARGSGAPLDVSLGCEDAHEVGGYQVLARRRGSWDALLSLLVELEASHHEVFRRLMGRLVRASTELDDEDLGFLSSLGATLADDIAAARDERRESEGYVTPVAAAAFLSSARGLRLDAMPWPPRPPSPSDGAGFTTTRRKANAVAHPVPRLDAGDGGDVLARLRTCMSRLGGDLHARRMEELGFAANALVAGASLQGRRFRPAEAARAAAAACNLGLESWPRAWLGAGQTEPTADLLVRHDLLTVFRVGWSVLHQRVCLPTARALVETLSRLASEDGALYEQLAGLRDALARQTAAGTPWRELDNLDVLLALDPPTWSVLVGLLDQCPVVPATTPPGFEFTAESRQIEWVSGFLLSLPDRLSDHGRRTPVEPARVRRRRARKRRGSVAAGSRGKHRGPR